MSEARIDKWMWAVRIFKTRTIAAEACKKGRITINGALAKAGLKKDFIILKVNGQPIRSEKDLTTIVNQTINANDQDRALFITGIFTNGQIAHFAVNLE